MSILATTELAVGFSQPKPRPLLENVNLTLEASALVCLLGPNGAGKTTLLRTLIGMLSPLRGIIRIDGDDISKLSRQELARRISVVLTDRVAPAMMSTRELVALGRQPYSSWLGFLSKQDEAIVDEALQSTNTENLASRLVSELSDGERQRVFVARALAQQPRLLVLDEPTAFLDLPHRVELMMLLQHLTRDDRRAALISTHDLDLALRYADTIWLMDGRGGISIGSPQELTASGAFTRAFGAAFELYQRHLT